MDIDASPELGERGPWRRAAWRVGAIVGLVAVAYVLCTIWPDAMRSQTSGWINLSLLAVIAGHGLVSRRFRPLEVAAVVLVIVVLGAGLVWPAWQKILDKGMVNLVLLCAWIGAGMTRPSEPPLAAAITSVRRAACRCGGCARPLTGVPPGADGCRECPKCGSAWKC